MISVQMGMPIGDCVEPYRMMSAILLVLCFATTKTAGNSDITAGTFAVSAFAGPLVPEDFRR